MAHSAPLGRHVLLQQIGITGQQKIAAATVMVMGCGGLGNAAIAYLAASGVRNLLLADFDLIDQEQLQRQILFGEHDVHKAKASVIEERLMTQYPGIVVTPIRQKLNKECLLQCLKSCDVLLDCSDSEQTRLLLNSVAQSSATPLITAAVSDFNAQIAVFDFKRPESPCYLCLKPEQRFLELAASDYTVLSPVVGVAGSMQAQEALRLIVGFGDAQAGVLIDYDALTWTFHKQQIKVQDACSVCNPSPRQHRA